LDLEVGSFKGGDGSEDQRDQGVRHLFDEFLLKPTRFRVRERWSEE